MENFARIAEDSYGTAEEKMLAFSDSVEAAQNRVTDAIDAIALWVDGAEVMKDFYNAIEAYIQVYFHQPVNQKEDLKGDLIAVDEQTITLSYKEKTRVKTIVIPFENISKAHLAIKF